ncbi:uncharacterized protein LOC117791982 [Drosophila innubila]|uniref:uncharacterized protein LOC117791982 n=1 Tax=Drosophila innubila TaxID=198719 RepID=UPI00148C39A5|nr:uncharacterized protein LOC117791982 [Drosophila innubila]
MHGMFMPLATLLPLMLLLPLKHLTEAVDKDVAPVGVAQTDLLSLEQEIGGNPAMEMETEMETETEKGVRKARSFVFGVGAGPAWIGGGYSWGYPGYGYYSSPYYYSYGNTGYYPGYFGYKKIIIG